MRAATVSQIFAELRRELVPLVQAITSQPPADDCLPAPVTTPGGAGSIRRGSGHARSVMISSAGGWIRPTTPSPPSSRWAMCASPRAYDEHDLGDALFSTVHEAGHAMYEQGMHRA